MFPSTPFLVASLTSILAPGPETFSLLTVGLSRGKEAAQRFGVGCALGSLTHTLWAVAGLTAAIAASPLESFGLQLCGAAYLTLLGLKIVLRRRGPNPREFPFEINRQFLVRGFFTNATNPKAAFFFLAFLPHFMDGSGDARLKMVWIGVLFSLMTVAVFGVLGLFSGEIGNRVRARPWAAFWLDLLMGGLFIGLGMRLALIHL